MNNILLYHITSLLLAVVSLGAQINVSSLDFGISTSSGVCSK